MGGCGRFASVFCGVFLKFPGSTVPTLDCSLMPAWTSMCMYLTSVQGWGGGDGGVDDVHANAAYSYYFSFCSVNW